MSANLNLMPNEAVILKEVRVARSGTMGLYTDELILTNLTLVCVNKNIFGNVKNVIRHPLNQIKVFNGNPQAIVGKKTNGDTALEVYFLNGVETVTFQTGSKKKAKKWAEAIVSAICGQSGESVGTTNSDKDYDPSTVVGAFKEIRDEFKEVGVELMGELGFKRRKKKDKGSSTSISEKVGKKCMSCSASLIGIRGQVVKCRYCDTSQTL